MPIVREFFGFLASGLGLVGLYLVLRHAGGMTQIIRAVSGFTVDVFRTLQAR